VNIDHIHKVFFVGVGGIGMSALARYFNHLGKEVYGYDKVEKVLTKQLIAEGIAVHYKDNVNQIPEGIDLVVYTPAIPDSHQELTYFREQDYTVMKRAAVLGLISKNLKVIGVAGTHGKTTTSAILTHLLRTGGIDCTAFLGGIANNINGNFVAGGAAWCVMEADEFDRSFLHLQPTIGIITSMDADHLDIYGNADSMEQSFVEYAKLVSNTLYAYEKLPIHGQVQATIKTYGTNTVDCLLDNIRVEDGYFVFDYQEGSATIKDLRFTLPGQHNALNATAAIGVARQLGCSEAAIREGLKTFQGIKRRFEQVSKTDTQVYIDDYAHHPKELEAAIKAARTLYPNRKITGVFQPHLYSRTKDFAEGFAKALDALDEVLLLDIYPAREAPIKGVSSAIIFDKMQLTNKQLIRKETLINTLENKNIDVLLTLGAGDIGALVPTIAQLFNKRKTK